MAYTNAIGQETTNNKTLSPYLLLSETHIAISKDIQLQELIPDTTSKQVIQEPRGNMVNNKDTLQESAEPNLADSLDDVFYIVEEMPKFMDGDIVTYRQYLKSQLKFPERLQESSPQGKVYASFIVEEDGSISHIKIVRGVDPLMDNEVLRVMRKIATETKWTPGKQLGKPVRVCFTIAASFATNY